MGSIAIDDVVRITANMLIDGVHDVNSVYNFKAVSSNSGDDDDFMVGVAVAIDAYHALINAGLTTRLTYVDISGINVTADRLMPSKPWPVLVAGTTGGEMLPETVAGCVFFRTTRPKTRASKFLAGYTELSNDGGALDASAVTTIQAYGDALVGGFASDGAVMNFGAYNTILARFTQVDSAIVPARWRTQRRRRFGVGS